MATSERISEQAPEVSPAAPVATPEGLAPLPILQLQRRIGNAATSRLLARRGINPTLPENMPDLPLDPNSAYRLWSEDEVRALQRELRRLRLYDLGLDGDFGPGTDSAMVEAFGGDTWRAMPAEEALRRLRAAQRPAVPGGGSTFRYGELLKDGVFDVTFGMGYKEERKREAEFNDEGQTGRLQLQLVQQLTDRGFEENATRAVEILVAAGRPVAAPEVGRWFVKENAATYRPVAGTERSIHAVVRVIRNTEAGAGQGARDAFMEGMTRGDAAFYTGHGRYGTGPDFDRNFLSFRIYDQRGGTLQQTITSYEVLEDWLRRQGGNPWTRFQRMVADGKIVVDFSNTGNIRLVGRSPHHSEFGGALIDWALGQQEGGSATATGRDGEMAKQAQASGRRYRLLAFAGCRTLDYEAAVRSTPGFGVREADVMTTNRTVTSGYAAPVFLSFIDSVLMQADRRRLTGAMNEGMRANEPGFTTSPFGLTGRGPRN